MNAARKRKLDVVLVYKFDRMARSTSHLLRVLEEFDTLRLDFVSYSENLDTSTPMGKAMFTIMGALAQLERDVIVERSKEGQQRAKKRGTHIGRPRKEVCERRVLQLRDKGLSLRAIAKAEGVSASVIRWVLREAAKAAWRKSPLHGGFRNIAMAQLGRVPVLCF
jgi:DNA invertase Pin-like site-specific DNA recombinase